MTKYPHRLTRTSAFNTDKNGLLFTLDKVKNVGPGISHSPTLPSLLYLNNYLENCKINYIKIEMEKESRTAQQVAWSRWGPSVFVSTADPLRATLMTIRRERYPAQ